MEQSTTIPTTSFSSEATTINGPGSPRHNISEPLIAQKPLIPFDLENQQPQPRSVVYTFVRYTALNVYRRLFSLVLIVNLANFIWITTTGGDLLAFINAAAANLLVGGLARQPLVINCMFKLLCAIPRSAPLRIRRICCKVYSYGGVHSGCGVAALIWYIGFVAFLTKSFLEQRQNIASVILLAVAYLILILLSLMVMVAYPTFRAKLHDYFELTHRFAGWAVIVLFWVLILTYGIHHTSSTSTFLLHTPAFWFLIITTFAVIQPWTLLRKVPVVAEVISSHAVRLHFSHTQIKFGHGLSLTHHPLQDWHGFATFPDPDSNGQSFSCLISKAGDWTSSTIQSPPTHIWKRGVPVYGFGYVMKVFQRIIVVTTGSGIGPCLSFLGDDNRPAMRVLWQTRSPLKTYGQRILDLVSMMDPNPIIMDTTKAGGRADMLPIILDLYQEFNAEAVCVISNPIVTKKLVFGLESRGIPAYGPLFDS